jgi:predicted MarR family transcription regulator
MNEVIEKEKRPATLEDLSTVTDDLTSLRYHLDRLESKGFIIHWREGGEPRYLKTPRGDRLERILDSEWDCVVELLERWVGKSEKTKSSSD